MRRIVLASLLASLAPLACSSASTDTGAAFGNANASGEPSAATPGGGGGGDLAAPGSGGGGPTGAGSGGGSGSGSGGGGVPSLPAPGQGGGADGGQPIPNGVLTAGAWDDVLNASTYASFVGTFAGGRQWPTTGGEARIVIQVLGDGDVPISNARVSVSSGTTTYVTAPTGSDGRVLVIPSRDRLPPSAQLTVTIAPAPGESFKPVYFPAPSGGGAWTFHVAGGAAAPPTALDLAFVVDTTGSMGDELAYLQSEIAGIASNVAQKFPNVSVRYGLVVYRDTVDPYVFRAFDFSDLGTFQSNLSAQSAAGGGDYPEQMQVGLHQMNALSWRDGNVARVAFLVADAPPHDQDVSTAFDEMNTARLHGVRLYGLAGSGAQEDAEYVLRAGAQITGARYLFLTDDSGIGDPHEIPHIPCYDVEHLNALVGRAIASELAGARVAPDPKDVIRTVGDPQNGVCAGTANDPTYLW